MKKQPRKRPEWDSFYMAQAFIASAKALDPDTQHGCVIVSLDNRILSSACNGPIRGSNDDEIPMERPDKYPYLIHAEENAILFYSGSNYDIQSATAYVTGRPCHRCLRMLMQKGIMRVVYANLKSKCVDEEELEIQRKMLALKKNSHVIVELYPYKEKIVSVIRDRLSYLEERVEDG